jgi:hypothetical protein
MPLVGVSMCNSNTHKKIVTQLLKKPLMIIAQENKRLNSKERLITAKISGNIEKN